MPLPAVDRKKMEADISPESPRLYVQTMLDMIYLAFKTDSTRVATYQIGRENGPGSAIAWLGRLGSISRTS